MSGKIPLVIATQNRGKIEEIKHLLAGFPVDLKTLDRIGPLPPFEETGLTFEDNAYGKSFAVASAIGFPALADDSGLVVDSLNGLPGVFSARYAGEGATDEENIRKLLKEMEGKTERRAAFECVISLAVPRGQALIYKGRVEGVILENTKGSGGFGYDPLFYYPPLDKTFAELTREEKNLVSHRGKALKELKDEFGKVLIWLQQRLRDQAGQ